MQRGFNRSAILVVEDNALLTMALEDTLTDAGFDVLGPALSVQDALRLLDHARPDAAVLDVNLNGTAVTPVALELQRQSIPFVLLSGYGADGIPVELRQVVNLKKPCSNADLLAALRALVAQAEAKKC